MKVTRTYSTRGTTKKFLGDAMKANKSITVKRRILKKVNMVENENLEVADVSEGEYIDSYIDAATEMRRK